MTTDEKLHREIMEELSWNPLINTSELKVVVKKGKVTLMGTVSNCGEKLATECAVRKVKGVKNVVVDLEVKLSTLKKYTDAEITQNIKKVFLLNSDIPHERIKAEVDYGWVFLKGDVTEQYQRITSINAIKYLPGIRGITDLIQVKPRITKGV